MKWASRMKRAQHKRPGASARRVRQQTALDNLWKSEYVQTERVQREIATLKRRLGIGGPHEE